MCSTDILNVNQRKIELLIEKGYSVFITRKGGSGKSFFLRSVIEKIQEMALLSRWEHCNVLIISEVSMLSRELSKKLETIARCLKKSSKPFGGIQLIVSGIFTS